MLTFPEFNLTLVRHGQSATNANPDLMGQLPDVPLTELGIKQSHLLQQRFVKENENFDLTYSSPYLRALHTAQIASPHSQHIIIVPELKEYNAGDWTSSSRAKTMTNDIKMTMGHFNTSFKPPGADGESLNMVERRVSEWFDKNIMLDETIIKLSDKKKENSSKLNIVFFTHGMVIKCLLHYIMNFDKSIIWKVNIKNTSVSRVSFSKEGWTINSINDCGHLI